MTREEWDRCCTELVLRDRDGRPPEYGIGEAVAAARRPDRATVVFVRIGVDGEVEVEHGP